MRGFLGQACALARQRPVATGEPTETGVSETARARASAARRWKCQNRERTKEQDLRDTPHGR